MKVKRQTNQLAVKTVYSSKSNVINIGFRKSGIFKGVKGTRLLKNSKNSNQNLARLLIPEYTEE